MAEIAGEHDSAADRSKDEYMLQAFTGIPRSGKDLHDLLDDDIHHDL